MDKTTVMPAFSRAIPLLPLKRLLCCTMLVFAVSALPAAAADKKEKSKGKAAEEAPAEEAPAPAARTTVRCEADVFYTWKRIPRPKPKPAQEGSAPDGKPMPAEELDPEMLKQVEVFFTRPGAVGASDEEAQKNLKTQLPEFESRAREVCERTHESESRCVMRQLRAVSKDYRLLDFQARKQFLDSVAEDCRLNTGICISTRAGEIVCQAELTAPPAAPAEAAPEEKKDSKKK